MKTCVFCDHHGWPVKARYRVGRRTLLVCQACRGEVQR